MENVRLILKGKTYQAKCIDENHYSFSLSDIKRSGKYTAEVYDGTNLIGNITFTVKGAVGSTNSGFDDLF